MKPGREFQLYRPSNGTEGMFFMEAWCFRCARDAANKRNPEKGCPILAATMAFDMDDPRYPQKWFARWSDADGCYVDAQCTAFQPMEILSERAKKAWETRRANRAASFAGELFFWD